MPAHQSSVLIVRVFEIDVELDYRSSIYF